MTKTIAIAKTAYTTGKAHEYSEAMRLLGFTVRIEIAGVWCAVSDHEMVEFNRHHAFIPGSVVLLDRLGGIVQVDGKSFTMAKSCQIRVIGVMQENGEIDD